MAQKIDITLPQFKRLPGVDYKSDYELFLSELPGLSERDKLGAIRAFILSDLFFVLYFVLEWGEFQERVNRPFVVERCREVEEGPEHLTLDLWARYHFKSKIREARTIQRILKFPERCTMIGSFSRPSAKKHLRSIKMLLEKSLLLKACFPDVLYDNPQNEADKWSEDDGIIVRRKNASRRESTLEAWGLIEGMPTGSHFDYIDVDDLETKDTVKNPDVAASVNDGFDTFFDMLTEDGVLSVWGTTWSHIGTYIPFLTDKAWPDGRKVFLLRKHPATSDGTRTGKPVLLSDEKWAELLATKSEYTINCQQLMNPTPADSRKLNPRGLQEIEPDFIPADGYRFLVIDPAGDSSQKAKTGKKGDNWSIVRYLVKKEMSDSGSLKCYIEDMALKPMEHTEAMETAVRMYKAGGVIQKVGIERDLTGTAGHLQRALQAEGRYIGEENGTLVFLSHGGKSVETRVVDALVWPLDNSCWFISKSVPKAYRAQLYTEIEKFPFYHPDGLNNMAYLYKLIEEFTFPARQKMRRPTIPKHAYGAM